MSQPRRRFLQQLGIASAALVLGRVQAASAPLAMPAAAGTVDFKHSTFAPYVGRNFSVSRAGAAPLLLKLTQISPLENTQGYAEAAHAREHCFTLLFRGKDSDTLDEGIHEFSAAGLGHFSAFASPIGRHGDIQLVFSQLA